MIVPGASVRVLAPFSEAFPGVYSVRSVDGRTAHLDGLPDGASDAFDFSYLEAV